MGETGGHDRRLRVRWVRATAESDDGPERRQGGSGRAPVAVPWQAKVTANGKVRAQRTVGISATIAGEDSPSIGKIVADAVNSAPMEGEPGAEE